MKWTKRNPARSLPTRAVAAALVLAAPGVAAACSVCMTGKEDDTRIAFELMTAFMTVIPFVLAGGVFYWLRGRLREIEAGHERARAASAEGIEGHALASPNAPGLVAVKATGER
jgi:NO-binding membrane sensor protein with MHYT domain